jgi:hypothetical protein
LPNQILFHQAFVGVELTLKNCLSYPLRRITRPAPLRLIVSHS